MTFFHGLYETAREPDELLVEVLIPEQKRRLRLGVHGACAAGTAISPSPALPATRASSGETVT